MKQSAPGNEPSSTPHRPALYFSRPLNLVEVSILCLCCGLPVFAAEDVSGTSNQLQEIVVTAEKKLERLQDVPVPVSVLTSESLLNSNQLRIQDYYSSVPGLNYTPDVRGNANVAIRGITTGPGIGNPPVGVTVDDVPFGTSSTYGSGGIGVTMPDLDPGDLARIEVLRGPQGTLYGASSIGGLVKFVTVDPSTDGFSGRVQAGLSGVQHGDHAGYNVRGSANLPVSDDLAVRVSAFTREDPGYIDNVLTDQQAVNKTDAEGAHLSALWRPSEALSIKFSALYQDSKGYGSSFADPSLGGLKQNYMLNTGRFDQKNQAYNTTIAMHFGPATITSVTGYNIFNLRDYQDWGALFGGFTQALYNVSSLRDADIDTTHKFSEELRLSTPLGTHLDLLLGAFYTHESSHAHQLWLPQNPVTLAIPATLLDATWPSTYQEYAGFVDLTVHFTDQFDLQIGGRESENRQTYSEVDGGDYSEVFVGTPGPLVTPNVDTKDRSFTYLVTPEYKFSPDLMLYARLASGYRPGGPNGVCAAFNYPCHFEPDRTRNYEVGFKGDLFDRRLTFDGSIYYIDWRQIQLLLATPVGTIFFNGGDAKSEGLELALQGRPVSGLTVGGWVAWNEAALTQNLPSTATGVGLAGDRLPDSARWTANLSVDDTFPLTDRLEGFVGGSAAYVGDRLGVFTGGKARQDFPSYTKVDLRAGGKMDGWTINLSATNVTDKRAALAGGIGDGFHPNAFLYIQPRTIALSASKSF